MIPRSVLTNSKIIKDCLHQFKKLLHTSPPVEPFKNVNIPEKFKLPMVNKIPSEVALFSRTPKGTRESYRIIGEERLHTKLLLGQFGIVALHGGYLQPKHFDLLRFKFGKYLEEKQSFAIYRVDPPYKPWTKHGLGKKLGGGKGGIDHYRTPIRAGRVIVEVGGKVYWEEVYPWLKRFANQLPFKAIPVTVELLDRLNKEEDRLDSINTNPISFEWLVRNNMFDCQRSLSPYDKKLFGKFMYRDRHLNLKWKDVLDLKYRKS